MHLFLIKCLFVIYSTCVDDENETQCPVCARENRYMTTCTSTCTYTPIQLLCTMYIIHVHVHVIHYWFTCVCTIVHDLYGNSTIVLLTA